MRQTKRGRQRSREKECDEEEETEMEVENDGSWDQCPLKKQKETT